MRLIAAALLLTALACSDESPSELPDMTAPDLISPWGTPLPATLAPDGQLVVAGFIKGQAAQLAMDTGAFPTAVDKRFAGSVITAEVAINVGPINKDKHLVAVADLARASSFVGLDLGALVGSDLLDPYYVGLDYKTPGVYLLKSLPAPPPPGATAAALPAPFTQKLGVPVVEATVASGAASKTIKLIADSGSGVTVITESTLKAMDPGAKLKRLSGYTWHTGTGSTRGAVVRLPSIKVGAAEVKGSWAVVLPDNHHMAVVLAIAGLPQGFLGFPFYRAFHTLYAGPDKRYLFYPGAGLAAPTDEWIHVGLELSQQKNSFKVEMIYTPSDASSQGVKEGDLLTAVDGKATAGSTLKQVQALLRGKAGEVKKLSISRAGKASVYSVKVEDLLP